MLLLLLLFIYFPYEIPIIPEVVHNTSTTIAHRMVHHKYHSVTSVNSQTPNIAHNAIMELEVLSVTRVSHH